MGTNAVASNEKYLENRAIGCLFGQVIGDALGTRYEFQNAKKCQTQIAADLDRKGHLRMLGGGPFHLEPGQFTDDTELAVAMIHSIWRSGDRFVPEDVASAYVTWYASPPFDIGTSTMQAFNMVSKFDAPADQHQKIIENSANKNIDSLSNGCLMRISPLAVAGTNWSLDKLQLAAKENAKLTNPHAVAQTAVSAYVTAIQALILTGDVQEAYAMAFEVAKEQPVVERHLKMAQEAAQPVPVEKDGKTMMIQGDQGYMGYLGVALQFAFYELLHAKSFEEGLVRVISRGGDTDTNGCIAGPLLGARFGADAIPEDWRETVLNCKATYRYGQYPWAKVDQLVEWAKKLLKIPEPL